MLLKSHYVGETFDFLKALAFFTNVEHVILIIAMQFKFLAKCYVRVLSGFACSLYATSSILPSGISPYKIFFPKEREEILAASLARDFQIKDDFNQRIVATAMRCPSASQSKNFISGLKLGCWHPSLTKPKDLNHQKTYYYDQRW